MIPLWFSLSFYRKFSLVKAYRVFILSRTGRNSSQNRGREASGKDPYDTTRIFRYTEEGLERSGSSPRGDGESELL